MGHGTYTNTQSLIIFIIDLLRFNFCKEFSSPGINEVIHQLTVFPLMGWEEKMGWEGKGGGKKGGPSLLL